MASWGHALKDMHHRPQTCTACWAMVQAEESSAGSAQLHCFAQVRVSEQPRVWDATLCTHTCIDESVVHIHSSRYYHRGPALVIMVKPGVTFHWKLYIDAFSIKRTKAIWKLPLHFEVLGYCPPLRWWCLTVEESTAQARCYTIFGTVILIFTKVIS